MGCVQTFKQFLIPVRSTVFPDIHGILMAQCGQQWTVRDSLLISTCFQTKPDKVAVKIGFPQPSEPQKEIFEKCIIVVTVYITDDTVKVKTGFAISVVGRIIRQKMIIGSGIPDHIFCPLFLKSRQIHLISSLLT